MLKHKQLPGSTNCYQVCIACLLNVPVHEVSHHFDGADGLWDEHKAQLHLFHKFKIHLLKIEWKSWHVYRMPIPVNCILTGVTSRSKERHAVIGEVSDQWHFVHDPHEDEEYLDEIEEATFLIPRIAQ